MVYIFKGFSGINLYFLDFQDPMFLVFFKIRSVILGIFVDLYWIYRIPRHPWPTPIIDINTHNLCKSEQLSIVLETHNTIKV